MHRYICHFLPPTRIGNRAKRKKEICQSKLCNELNNLVQSIYIVVAAAVMLCIHPDHPADKSVRFMSLAAFWCAGMFNFLCCF